MATIKIVGSKSPLVQVNNTSGFPSVSSAKRTNYIVSPLTLISTSIIGVNPIANPIPVKAVYPLNEGAGGDGVVGFPTS